MDKIKSIEETRNLNNKKYREWYKNNVRPKNYSPFVHLGFNFTLLIALVVFHFLMLKEWTLVTFALIGMMFVVGNIVVFIVHKYPLHRRLKFWTFPYDTHTVEHHRYFTAETITYENSMDFNAVFFPMSVIGSFSLIGQPAIYFGVRYFFDTDVAHIIAGSAAGYFLTYEFFHWASHLPHDHVLMNIPWIKYMREHHIAHHNPRLMNKYNFCIVDPSVDILLGTKYRGNLPQDLVEDHYQDVKSNL